MLKEKMEDFIAAADRLHLGDYVRYECDRKRRLLDAFFQGIMRGIGAMIGFAVIGAMIVWLLRRIAENSLPGIGAFIAEIVEIVKLRVN